VRIVYNVEGTVEIPRFDVNELGITLTDSIYGFSMILRINGLFLGAFAKLQKATIIIMSVCLSAWDNSAPTGRIFVKFDV
jgi:hypothetical protein